METSSDSVSTTRTRAELVDHYDALIYSPKFLDFCGQSAFANFGYWESNTATHEQACETMMKKLLALLPEKKGRILDVACGKGATTRYLHKHYPPDQVSGINVSAQQLATSRTNAPGSHFVLMDASRLGFQDDSFDSIICVEAAFHFNTRERFLREAHRILKPGGTLVLSDILMTREAERRRKFRTEENYVPDPNAYQAVLSKAGYQDLTVLDVTESCWKEYYRYVVRTMHEKYLSREIDRDTLHALLAVTYDRVPDMEYYLLAAAKKPA